MNFLDLQILLDHLLHAARFAATGDPNGAFRPSARPDKEIRCLGLALEPLPGWREWAEREECDALFLHRPWGLDHGFAAPDVGVLAYHLAFDESLTTGFNPTLAATCGWGEPAVLAEKAGRPLGMVCALADPATPTRDVIEQLRTEFGGLEAVTPPSANAPTTLGRVACVGAMSDPLVRAAQAAGAGLYITGQWRPSARAAVEETGIGLAVIGHHRSELWGLRTLARLLLGHPEMAGVKVVHFSLAGVVTE